MDIEETLRRYIAAEILDGEGESAVETDTPLVSSGLVDSLNLLRLLEYITQHYGTDLLATEGPESFETVGALAEAIKRQSKQ